MEPFGGTGKATSLLDAIYKIGMMPVNASKTIEDSNKWRKGVRRCVLIITDATFHKRATLPEIKDLDALEIYEKIWRAKLRLFLHVPEWEGYNLLEGFPYSRTDYYIIGDPV